MMKIVKTCVKPWIEAPFNWKEETWKSAQQNLEIFTSPAEEKKNLNQLKCGINTTDNLLDYWIQKSEVGWMTLVVKREFVYAKEKKSSQFVLWLFTILSTWTDKRRKNAFALHNSLMKKRLLIKCVRNFIGSKPWVLIWFFLHRLFRFHLQLGFRFISTSTPTTPFKKERAFGFRRTKQQQNKSSINKLRNNWIEIAGAEVFRQSERRIVPKPRLPSRLAFGRCFSFSSFLPPCTL